MGVTFVEDDAGVETKIDTIDTVVDGIQTDLDNGTDGLGALKTLVDTATTNIGTVDTVVDGIQTDLSNATDGLGALKILIDANQTDLDAIIVGTVTNATGADVSTDVVNMKTSADTGYANMINIVGEGGHSYTAATAAEPADNVSIMGGLRYVAKSVRDGTGTAMPTNKGVRDIVGTEYVDANGVPEIDNIRAHLFKTGGMGGGVATKTLTFSNNGAGTLTLFTVTGDVIVKIIATCGTLVTSGAAANVEVGVPGTTDGIIATTVATAIDADEIWHDATPDSGLEALSTMREYIIVNGANIGITLSAQVDTGAITFHCIWTGLNGGTVVVA